MRAHATPRYLNALVHDGDQLIRGSDCQATLAVEVHPTPVCLSASRLRGVFNSLMPVCQPACLPTYLSVCLRPACRASSIDSRLPVSLPVFLSVFRMPSVFNRLTPACQPACLSVCLPPACLSVCVPHAGCLQQNGACLPASLPVCLSVYLCPACPASLMNSRMPASPPACLSVSRLPSVFIRLAPTCLSRPSSYLPAVDR
jgi:hypothetical protein